VLWSPVPQTKHFCCSLIQKCRIDELLPTLLFNSGNVALDCKTYTKWVCFPSSCISISSTRSSVRRFTLLSERKDFDNLF
jgi:hypothetical protein